MIYLLVGFAALFSAIADSVENEHFFGTVFRKLNQRFWFKRVSWAFAKMLFGYKFDAWHISKSLMIFCFCAAIAENFWQWIYLGIVWNVVFFIFYSKLFKK